VLDAPFHAILLAEENSHHAERQEKMKKREVDVAIIGAGTAGLAARREAKKAGASVVLIEGGPYGTTCARVGCMPSKLLIHSADVAHEVSTASNFGVEIQGRPRVNGKAVLERVRRERDRFVGFVLDSVNDIPGEEKVAGYARFDGPGALLVDDHTRIEARAIVVASGSSPWIPSNLSGLGDRLLISDDIFEFEDLPGSVAVVGMGVIGLELGQSLHRLGVDTLCLTPSSRVGPLSDPVIKKKTIEVFGQELNLHVGVEGLKTRVHDDGVHLDWVNQDGSRQEAVVDYLLGSAGRRPNLARLDPARATIPLDERGLPTIDRDTAQIGDLPIFLAGDVSNYRTLLHEAADEGRIAGHNAARYPDVQAFQRRTLLSVVFSDPQIAVVGKPYGRLDPASFTVGEVSYDDQGRSRVMGKNSGHVRIYAENERGTLLGAEMLGPRVEHTAHLLAWAVQQGLTVDGVLRMPFYHPVVEEGIRTALRDLADKLNLEETLEPK
jgi:dihydrolipoamide dehydrogenase